MSDYIIWHNPRCSKSRQTLALLQDHGIEPEDVRYLETPPSKQQIKNTLKKLGIPAIDLVRRGESAFKALALSKDASEAELIEAMSKEPVLIERPVVIHGDRAVLGRPPENVLDLID
ncbi:MAG: arsenate reductase (glutaredoxin) [Cellvibrionales bacterium]|jgi:arsenate reductase|nr:arsenate reductase (glutaredoxin) [Cellvibrionales bacterium]